MIDSRSFVKLSNTNPMVAVDNSRIINGNQTLRSKERISTKTPGGHSNIEKPKILKLATINIQHAGNSKLEQATRCLREMKIDIAVLTETKLPIYHTTNCEGYHITVSEAVSNSQGGVALCVQCLSAGHGRVPCRPEFCAVALAGMMT